jgi:hypothetical protein
VSRLNIQFNNYYTVSNTNNYKYKGYWFRLVNTKPSSVTFLLVIICVTDGVHFIAFTIFVILWVSRQPFWKYSLLYSFSSFRRFKVTFIWTKKATVLTETSVISACTQCDTQKTAVNVFLSIRGVCMWFLRPSLSAESRARLRYSAEWETKLMYQQSDAT